MSDQVKCDGPVCKRTNPYLPGNWFRTRVTSNVKGDGLWDFCSWECWVQFGHDHNGTLVLPMKDHP